MSRLRQVGATRFRVFLMLAILAAAVPATMADKRISARAIEVHFHSLTDAADLIDPLMSERGTVTLRPRLKTLVVQDVESILDRVEALINNWDRPPQNVEITISLFLGTDRRDQDSDGRMRVDKGLSAEVRGIMEKLSDFTKWTTYEPLGSRSVTGTEGSSVEVNLSDNYRVLLAIDSVHPSHKSVRFDKLQLQRVSLDDDGNEQIEDLYTAGMVLPQGKLKLVGAAAGPNSQRVLFLALKSTAPTASKVR